MQQAIAEKFTERLKKDYPKNTDCCSSETLPNKDKQSFLLQKIAAVFSTAPENFATDTALYNKKKVIEAIADSQQRGSKIITELLHIANMTETTENISEMFSSVKNADVFLELIMMITEGARGIGKALCKEIAL